jgi:predicted HD superfamily hydrolase involved in NAD metabolism
MISEKNIQKIKKHLKSFLPSARFKHSLGVASVALILAEKYGISKGKAYVAALLHDIGKGYTRNGMIKYIKKHKIKIDNKSDLIKYGISLAHGNISAHIARNKFGVKDHEVLNAIISHTLGRPRMSKLAKIIYLADASSPDRRHPYVKKLRKRININLDNALLYSMGNKLSYVLKKKKWIHPDAVKAWNSVIKKRNLNEN